MLSLVIILLFLEIQVVVNLVVFQELFKIYLVRKILHIVLIFSFLMHMENIIVLLKH